MRQGKPFLHKATCLRRIATVTYNRLTDLRQVPSGWPLHKSNFLIISLVIKTSVPVPKASPQMCQPSCPPALLPSQGQALSEDRHSEVLGEGRCRIVPTKFPKQTTKISHMSLPGPIGAQLSQHLTDGQHQSTVRHLPGQTAFKLGVTMSSGA